MDRQNPATQQRPEPQQQPPPPPAPPFGAAAFEAADAVPGTITVASADGDHEAAFAWLADADSRIGPIFEAVINGKYYWVPASAVAALTIEAPEDLRDFVWMPAQFRWQNGGEAASLSWLAGPMGGANDFPTTIQPTFNPFPGKKPANILGRSPR